MRCPARGRDLVGLGRPACRPAGRGMPAGRRVWSAACRLIDCGGRRARRGAAASVSCFASSTPTASKRRRLVRRRDAARESRRQTELLSVDRREAVRVHERRAAANAPRCRLLPRRRLTMIAANRIRRPSKPTRLTSKHAVNAQTTLPIKSMTPTDDRRRHKIDNSCVVVHRCLLLLPPLLPLQLPLLLPPLRTMDVVSAISQWTTTTEISICDSIRVLLSRGDITRNVHDYRTEE